VYSSGIWRSNQTVSTIGSEQIKLFLVEMSFSIKKTWVKFQQEFSIKKTSIMLILDSILGSGEN